MRATLARLVVKLLLLLLMWGWLLVEVAVLEPRNLHIETTEAVVPGWPADAAPARLVLLADIHAAKWDGEWLDRVVETTVAAQPELIILLGDYCFTGGKRWFAMRPEEVARHLAPLGKQCPVYYVRGNHDLFLELININKALSDNGFISLENGQDRPVRFANGCRLRLRGGPFIPEKDSGDKLKKIFAPEPPEKKEKQPPLLCVIHNPYHFLKGKFAGDLVVCGHTHGGQICLPGAIPFRKQGPVTPEMQRAGWHRTPSGTPLYISRGIGSTLIPIRLNCPPEITILRLKGRN